MEVIDLGIRGYREVWELQKRMFNMLIEAKLKGADEGTELLYLVEHKPVYTLGLHGNQSNMLMSETQLSEQGIEFVAIERGGDITFHGPGQLVVYPIIDMQRHSLGVKSYVNLLEESVIRTIREYGIVGERVDGATGVWIDVGTSRERKICAIGVKCKRYVTMHGLALNVNTDLKYFSAINPCGFIDKGVTSIEKEIGHSISMYDVKARFVRNFMLLIDK